MTISGIQAWITSAVEEKDVQKALVLAGSLRRVCTSKKLVVMTTLALSETSSDKLKKAFDLVFPMKVETSNGLNLEEYAKVEAFSLQIFSKCLYLAPSTVVLKNCDEIFAQYGKFAALPNDSNSGVDSSVYLFTPSLEYGKALGKIVHPVESKRNGGISSDKKIGGFGKCFSLWVENHIPNWEKLDESYNVHLNLRDGLPRSLGSKVNIANFGAIHPLDFILDGCDKKEHQSWGPIEKLAVQKCMKIYQDEVDSSSNLDPSALSMPPDIYQTEPIAIVGMSFRLPGGNNVDEFWDLLINGKEAIRYLPESRWAREHTHVPCQNRKVEGGFLSIPVDEFDAKFFGISGKEAEVLDPQQRLLHEIAWEALEEAMIDTGTLRGSKTGVFVGSWLYDYKEMLIGCTDLDFFRAYMGNSVGAGAARLSHFLETTGPSIGTESGCSSAIVAVDMAIKSLRNHESNLALACGVNLLLKPFDCNMSFVVSPDGRCKTFDEGANGFGRAEGCAVLVLKRLSDAVKDGDNIWGMIRGSAMTQEGVSNSFGTPTVHCESLAMRLALDDANVDPADVSYVEAHGTGTPVGDPMEVAAIGKAYSKGRTTPLLIGSVKTNVGHTESVSGITGIIKVLLSMKNEKIPPHLNLNKLNPNINLDVIPAQIPLEPISWPKQNDKPRLAGVSSFGITGTDGHVIIQEPPQIPFPHIQQDGVRPRPLHIMKLSAKSPESLDELLVKYENIFSLKDAEVDGFADVAYSANIGRTTFNHRAVIIAKDFADAKNVIRGNSIKRSAVQSGGSQLCFLFTGQGSQYPKMGEMLYSTSPIFKHEFDNCDQILRSRYGINLREVLWGQDSNVEELSRTLNSQTSIFCIEYCLLKLWESWGVKPDFVMGHSLGEFCAAVAAGALNFEDALMLVAERSKLIDNLPQGKMLVIQADKQAVDQMIEKYKQIDSTFWVDYAALNSPEQTVVAGNSTMIEEFAKFCTDKSLKTTILAATQAFHSRHMEPMLEKYRKVAATVKPLKVDKDAPKYISGMEGKLLDLETINADYWVRHTREPVNFVDACKVIQSEGCSLFLELGPHPVLSALTMMNVSKSSSMTCLPSLRRKKDDWATLLETLAKLFLSDWKGQLNWKGFDSYYNRSRVALPFYPFNRKPIWMDLEPELPNVHPLLGKHVPTKSDHTILESRLSLKNTPFIQDHVIGNTVIFPGAGFLEMCLAGGHASAQVTSQSMERNKPQRPVSLKSLRISSPLAFYDSVICKLQTTVKLDVDDNDDIVYSVSVHRYVPPTSDGIGEWITHATGSYLPVPALITKGAPPSVDIDIPKIQSTWEKAESIDFYEKLPEVGLRFGPQFRSLGMGWKSDNGILISVNLPPTANHGGYLIHPVVGDAMLQATMLWARKDPNKKMKLQVPVQIGEFTWFQSSKSEGRYIYCSTDGSGKTDCVLLDGEGTKLAHMTGVDFMETTVKLVEGMIQQQHTAMPKTLWREIWKSDPGALESAYDLRILEDRPFLQFNDQQRVVLAKGNELEEYERSVYENLCNLANLFFLKAMYELGWKPIQGTPFSVKELWALLPNPKEHFKKYIQFFVRKLTDSGIISANSDNDNLNDFVFTGPPPAPNEIENGLLKTVRPGDITRVDYQLVVVVGKNLSKIWLGEVDPLQTVFPSDPAQPSVGQLYNEMVNWHSAVFNQVNDVLFMTEIDRCYEAAMGLKQSPILRILEVGSGTGVFSEMFLTYLGRWGKPFEFYFTDISASFFNAAEKRLEKYLKHMTFQKFDMEKDPLVQGFHPEYFDIILACEVLHVAKDIRKTLTNLKCLMKPGGILQISETTVADPRSTQIVGPLEGYWQFEDLDCRPDHTTLTPEGWEQVLKETNYDKVVCAPVYGSVHSIITAKLSSSQPSSVGNAAALEAPQNSWLIFCHDDNDPGVELLADKLNQVNRRVHIVRRPATCEENAMKELMKSEFSLAKNDVERVEGVLYLWGLLDNIADRDQRQISLPLINLVHEMNECKLPPRLYVVTRGAVFMDGSEVSSPSSATLHGIIKSLTNEKLELHQNCLDLPVEGEVAAYVDNIFHNLWTVGKANRSIAIVNGHQLSARFASSKVNYNEPLPLPSGCDRFQLQLPKTRLISDLEFVSLEAYALEESEIEVEVKAVGLNFRDVFTVLKPIAEFENFNTVGLDFSGVVTKVGSKVVDRKVGDRVMGLNMENNLSLPSHIKAEESLVVEVPPSFTFAEGATLPAVFFSGVEFLINNAKMKRGDTVLVHTASGGVGLCAVQLAKRVGAEVIATAGSKRKQNYLRNLGIKHVFHSRTTDFGKQILQVTNGRGVDIVLNSITGEGFKEASLSALAKNGRFIEMSKLNVWTPEEVKKLRPDVFYKLGCLKSMSEAELNSFMELFNDYLRRNDVTPIPYEKFDALNIRGALNYLQKAKHIGKIVCMMPEVKVENSKITATIPLFNELSTYLVTGGLGGIGFEVVKWMLKSGAKHIAIVSRSKPKPEITRQLESLNKMGSHVEAFPVDIGDFGQCQQLFNELQSPTGRFPKIRGVMHAAGVLADGIIENQTWDNFLHCYNPKVNGTWNLHDLTKELSLEHFVTFSSIAAAIGTPGQANHAASNSFEDALVAYRRSNGLPGTSINWGNWGEVGVATELDFPGVRPISTSQGLLILDTFLRCQETHLSVFNFESFALAAKIFPSLKNYVDDKRLFGELKANVIINSDEFWKKVDNAENRQEVQALFKEFIRSILRNILKMDQDEVVGDLTDFQSLGVDSLMMIEMKNGLQSILGSRMTLTATQLKDCNNIQTLGTRLVSLLDGGEDYSKIILPTFEQLQELVLEDAKLPEHIRPSSGMQAVELSQVQNILLTGATGVLGPYLLRELSNLPNINRITCLVRKVGKLSPSDRLLKRLKDINLEGEVDMSKVECIHGDITDDMFGLSEEDYNRLAEDTDAVVNSAVRADHTAKYYKAADTSKIDLRTVNVKGTARILEFAVHSKLKHVYQGSSLLSVTTTDTYEDNAGDDEEDCYDLDNEMECVSEEWEEVDSFDKLPYNLGYPLSKHVSEMLCKDAVQRGIPVKTFRFPVIGGDAYTGRCDYRTNHVILRWLTYLKLKCMPDVPMPMVVISVNDCARISLSVFLNSQAPPDVYNVSHPGGSVDQIMVKIAEEYGISIKPVPTHDFIDKLKVEGDDSPLAPFMKLYRDDEEELFEIIEQNTHAKGFMKSAEESTIFFRSRKLAKLVENYDGLEPTEAVMRRDIKFLKESGVFDKFEIKL